MVEGRLAEQFDISRTPIREALLRLEAEGLLVKQGSGSYSVRRITASEFIQCMRVRALLEPEAAALAAGRIAADDLQTHRSRIAGLVDPRSRRRRTGLVTLLPELMMWLPALLQR